MDKAGNHHSQQTDTRTENQTPHVFTYRLVMGREGHREENNTQWVRWWGEGKGGEGQWGAEGMGRDSLGRNAKCG